MSDSAVSGGSFSRRRTAAGVNTEAMDAPRDWPDGLTLGRLAAGLPLSPFVPLGLEQLRAASAAARNAEAVLKVRPGRHRVPAARQPGSINALPHQASAVVRVSVLPAWVVLIYCNWAIRFAMLFMQSVLCKFIWLIRLEGLTLVFSCDETINLQGLHLRHPEAVCEIAMPHMNGSVICCRPDGSIDSLMEFVLLHTSPSPRAGVVLGLIIATFPWHM